MFQFNSLYNTDGYKIGHRAMLADGTDFLYGTWIPRSLKHAPKGIDKVVSFGQQMVWKWIHDNYEENFFKKHLEDALQFIKDMSLYLNLPYDGEHFIKLHKLGYLPILVKSLPEGIETPVNVPHMTFINTKAGFAWLPLYLETIVSALAWKPSTSATIALKYKRNAIEWVKKTDEENLWLVGYMCHDFSSRGLDPWSMISSGLGHATSHRGSDTLPVIPAARYFYKEAKDAVCINSVNASEHSVSTTKIFTVGEKQMILDWLSKFPDGIFSLVSDTFDLFKLITEYLTDEEVKKLILARNGKLVIRPDSGDPVDIICGTHYFAEFGTPQEKGVIELLWDIFGGTINKQGYKVLDPHIGAIYGDSITTDRQVEIYKRLEAKGFAATNIVLGVGSFTYQYNTRDTFGFAAKGAWFEAFGKGYDIYKDPATDDGSKRSLKGLLRVEEDFTVKQQCTKEEESGGILHIIYHNGYFHNEISLTDVRDKLSRA